MIIYKAIKLISFRMPCLLDAGEFLEAEEFSFSIALYSWQNFTPN